MPANFTIEIKVPELTELTEVLKQFINVQMQKPAVAPVQNTTSITPQEQVVSTAPVVPPQTPAYSAPAQTLITSTASPATQQVPIQTAPVAPPPTYAQDDLARAASQLMDVGKQKQLVDLLGTFNVQALIQLPKDKYGEFATALRQLGAKI